MLSLLAAGANGFSSISDGKSQSDATRTHGTGGIVDNHTRCLLGRFLDFRGVLHFGVRFVPEDCGAPGRHDHRICGPSGPLGNLGRSQRNEGLVERLTH